MHSLTRDLVFTLPAHPECVRSALRSFVCLQPVVCATSRGGHDRRAACQRGALQILTCDRLLTYQLGEVTCFVKHLPNFVHR